MSTKKSAGLENSGTDSEETQTNNDEADGNVSRRQFLGAAAALATLTGVVGEADEYGEAAILEEIPDSISDYADSREEAATTYAWDRAHRARVALNGDSPDHETARQELQTALAALEITGDGPE